MRCVREVPDSAIEQADEILIMPLGQPEAMESVFYPKPDSALVYDAYYNSRAERSEFLRRCRQLRPESVFLY